MQRTVMLVCLLVLSLVLAHPPAARAEIYVEAYVGGERALTVFAPYLSINTPHPLLGSREEHQTRGGFDFSVIGGLKLGTWFVPEGFLGYNYPAWMKYFGFYLDFSYHRHNFLRATGHSEAYNGGVQVADTHNFWSEGHAATLAFMFVGRYGFFRDSEVPFGRLQPYLAVGPAIIFTTQDVSLISFALNGQGGLTPYGIKAGSSSDVVPALATDLGVRWMALKNVSLDLSFKFRWAHPSFTYRYVDPLDGTPQSFNLHPTNCLASIQLGVAYHF
jgi:hypothetical protein